MKKAFIFLIFSFLVVGVFAQNKGTIKVAKPVVKDSVVKYKVYSYFFSGGINYTYLKNNSVGYNCQIGYFLSPNYFHRLSISVIYSKEYRYFNYFNFNNGKPFIEKSQTALEYLKLPLHYSNSIVLGNRSGFLLNIGMGCKYLLAAKNPAIYSYRNFNQFNGYYSLEMAFRLFHRKNLLLNFSYNRDIFENLKDSKLYDENHNVIGKQKSRTTLTSISFVYIVNSIKNKN